MALRIDANKAMVVQAMEAHLKATERVKNTTKEPEFIPIVERRIKEIKTAIESIAEIKETKA